MATTKTTTLTFRIEPALKDALRTAAEQEHRSIANMVEMMIRDYCAKAGVTIAEPTVSERLVANSTDRQSMRTVKTTTILGKH